MSIQDEDELVLVLVLALKLEGKHMEGGWKGKKREVRCHSLQGLALDIPRWHS